MPLERFEPPSDALEERCLIQLDHKGVTEAVGFEPTVGFPTSD